GFAVAVSHDWRPFERGSCAIGCAAHGRRTRTRNRSVRENRVLDNRRKSHRQRTTRVRCPLAESGRANRQDERLRSGLEEVRNPDRQRRASKRHRRRSETADVCVDEVTTKERKRNPVPPFIT